MLVLAYCSKMAYISVLSIGDLYWPFKASLNGFSSKVCTSNLLAKICCEKLSCSSVFSHRNRTFIHHRVDFFLVVLRIFQKYFIKWQVVSCQSLFILLRQLKYSGSNKHLKINRIRGSPCIFTIQCVFLQQQSICSFEVLNYSLTS